MELVSSLGAGFSISQIIEEMSGVQMGVWIFMLLMSIWMVAIVVERLIRLKKANNETFEYVTKLRDHLAKGRSEDALRAARMHEKSPVANVVGAGLEAQQKALQALQTEGPADVGEFDIVDSIHRAIDRTKERETTGLRRGLGSLATIASSAPFVGLLGTVIGIISAFTTMDEGVTLDKLGPKIGEALYATAFGLIVAIPAAMLFNYFTTRVENMVVDINEISSEFIDYVLKEGRA